MLLRRVSIIAYKATVIIFFVSRHIETPKATRLGEKKINWAKKKRGSPAPHKLKQFWRQCVPGIEWMFFFATLWDNVAFLQQTCLKKEKKKRGKEVKCQTDLAEGDNHACVSTDRSWYCSWVSCVKLWNMNSSILQTLPYTSFSRQSVAQDFR